MGFEPTTSCLASRCSTSELLPPLSPRTHAYALAGKAIVCSQFTSYFFEEPCSLFAPVTEDMTIIDLAALVVHFKP